MNLKLAPEETANKNDQDVMVYLDNANLSLFDHGMNDKVDF